MKSVSLFVGHEHACSYLPDRLARSVFVDPAETMSAELYSALAAQGFRRSGTLVYRPQCRTCAECIPARLAVERFVPDRSQRRIARRNRDLTVHRKPAAFDEEHYRLFRRYQSARHREGGMAELSREDYLGFLASSWSHTRFVEFRGEGGKLLGVAVIDLLQDGLSAVYTFYDPDASARSLGTYAVLWQITEAQRMGLPWVYLGYWIAESPKMSYKNRFRPLQLRRRETWEDAQE